jgi:hypothetical protein
MSARAVPAGWTDADRRLFLNIAKRRKEEHVSAYAVVGIGAQLYLSLLDNKVNIVSNEGNEQTNANAADPTSELHELVDGDAQDDTHA